MKIKKSSLIVVLVINYWCFISCEKRHIPNNGVKIKGEITYMDTLTGKPEILKSGFFRLFYGEHTHDGADFAGYIEDGDFVWTETIKLGKGKYYMVVSHGGSADTTFKVTNRKQKVTLRLMIK